MALKLLWSVGSWLWSGLFPRGSSYRATRPDLRTLFCPVELFPFTICVHALIRGDWWVSTPHVRQKKPSSTWMNGRKRFENVKTSEVQQTQDTAVVSKLVHLLKEKKCRIGGWLSWRGQISSCAASSLQQYDFVDSHWHLKGQWAVLKKVSFSLCCCWWFSFLVIM